MNRLQTLGTLVLGLSLLSLTPAAAQISVMGELSQDRQAISGETYEGAITVRNSGLEETEVKVYQADYLFQCDRTTRYDEPGTTARSNARWTSFAPERMVVPPRTSIEVRYTVTIPAGDSLTGSYWSMLMVEEINRESPESVLGESKAAMGVRQVLRYGVQIATHLAASAHRSMEFGDVRLGSETDSTALLEFTISSTGTLWMRPAVSVELFDAQGRSQGTFAGQQMRIYPGTCVNQAIRLPKFPSGPYKALLVVDAGGDDVFGAQFDFLF